MFKRLFVVALFSLLVWTGVASATPPEALDLAYNLKTQMLTVHVKHTSRDRRTQYIRQFSISVNGKFVKNVFYGMQPTRYEFSEDVPVTAKVGDVISLTAYGSEGGSKDASVTVKQPKAAKPAAP